MVIIRPCLTVLILLLLTLLLIHVTLATPDNTLSQSEISIRQAHAAWVSFTRETEMNAAITYIYPLYGTDTSKLTSLVADFKKQEALIPSTTTLAGFENLTEQMQAVTEEFRDESEIQMTIGHGNSDSLAQAVGAATAGNPYIEQKRQAYWSARKTNQLRDFDAWCLASQNSLDTLKKQGFDTAAAQRTLDVTVSKRPDLLAALESRNEDRILAINAVILPLSRQLGDQVVAAQGKVSDAEKMDFLIGQGHRGVLRADRFNNDIRAVLIDIDPLESATNKVKTDLTATKTLLATGSIPNAKTPLSLVKKDMKDLSMLYREIASSADLPRNLTIALRSMVITLDNTADVTEVSE